MPPINPQAPQNNPGVPPQTSPPAGPPPMPPQPAPMAQPVAPAPMPVQPAPLEPMPAPLPVATPEAAIPPLVAMPDPEPVMAPPMAEPAPTPASNPMAPQTASSVQPVMPEPAATMQPTVVEPATVDSGPVPVDPSVGLPVGAVPAMPGSTMSPVDPSLGLPLDHDAAMPVPEAPHPDAKPHSKKKLFIIIGVVLASLAIAGGAWAMLGMPGVKKADAPETTQDTDAGAGDATNFDPDAATNGGAGGAGGTGGTDSSSGGGSSAALAYGTITRPCYSFSLPTPNTGSKDTSCKIDAVFGNPSTNKILILPSTATFSSLESALAIAKETYKLNAPVDKKIKLGGTDAYETTYTTSSGKKAVKIIVGAVGRNYKLAAANISGFEINMPATSANDLAAVAELEKTWVWK